VHDETHRWVTADQFGVAFPADPTALRCGGPRFLTDAFRAASVLAEGNAVTGINGFREITSGSTGHKVVLSVEYKRPLPGLHTDLFVKFSRDFDNIQDRGKTQYSRKCGSPHCRAHLDSPSQYPTCSSATTTGRAAPE
jgi:hypothetical protein